jgi:hypothetical protein
MDFKSLSEAELLRLHAGVIDELLRREVVRTANNPIGDYTEWLVGDWLGLALEPNSRASYDGTDATGIRYQIKGRRSKRPTGNVQFSVIRNLETRAFDYVIAVVFNPDYTIRFAAKIPDAIVTEVAVYRKHVNGYVPIIGENIFERIGVTDITSVLSQSQSTHMGSEGTLAK